MLSYKTIKRASSLGLAVVVLVLLSFSIALAQSGNGFNLNWWTVDSGGGAANGGEITLQGTIGQPEVGEPLSGGGMTLTGGFWFSGAEKETGAFPAYLPLVTKEK
jgi:hypothetical protein